MRSFLGTSAVVVVFAGATFVACGGSNTDQAKSANDQRAMNQLTPVQREEAQRRAGQEDERERELAAAREPRPASGAPNEATRTTTALAVSSIATARCD